ncbi:MAG: (2Fe-2S)-binding protein [Planctomycetales bacterium]|nr:(2Fe-2S)-binding protein [Planctomycetales bacterium]
MAIVTIDGQEIEIGDDERLNGIQAARRAGAEVPHYCWHPGLSVVASCRMCLVETGTKDKETGEVRMMPKLVPACQTPASDGTVFVTDSQKVRDARAMVEEDLLIRHPIDCPICDKAGECALQDYHFQHGREERRADIKPFTSRRRDLGETVTLFVDRCVMCSRCVRFCREVAGTAELMIRDRGAHEEIDVFPGFPLENKMSGNVVDLCPVGALGDIEFLYRQRVWFMKSHDHVCGGCSAGCSIRVDENQDHVYRIKPRENPEVNQWWICDEGRYGWGHIHSADRNLTASRRGNDGEHRALETAELVKALDAALRASGRLAVVVSPFLTVEEAYLLSRYAKSIDSEAALYLGPVPVVGEDETFASGFTIRNEKCPNRVGVEEVISHFMQGNCESWEALLSRDDLPSLAVWVSGGSPQPLDHTDAAEALSSAALLVVHDLFGSPLYEAADFRIPDAASLEREGSYVNRSHRLQSFEWAVRAPAGVVPAGRLLWQLTGGHGLYRAANVLQEAADAISAFAVAKGSIPSQGVDLKVNLLA